MAIITLSTSSNYSDIKGSLANGDTIRIDTTAVRLTVDEQPLLTGISVDSPGVGGRMTVSGAYDLSTWHITAGTLIFIDGTFPAGATLGSATGGQTSASSNCVNINDGTILVSNGGAFAACSGVTTNNGTVGTANGGSAGTTFGVTTNNGTVTTANGGTTGLGVGTNNGTVTNANGAASGSGVGVSINNATVGTANGGATADGVSNNNGTVTTANGGASATANGINLNNGICLRAFDGVGLAITANRGGPKLIIGPDYQTATASYTAVDKIYSIGEVSNLAAIPLATEVVILSEGGGSGGFSLSRVLN
jgi:hypothetical protein